MCPKHDKHLKFICFDDQQAICKDCIAEGHASHEWDLYADFLSDIKQKASKIETLVKRIKDTESNNLINNTKLADEKRRAIINHITSLFDRL